MRAATTSELVLYSTSACHLCEQALALLQPWLERGVSLQEVDISDDELLFERYGWLIPVLRCEASDSELHWPFSDADVAGLLGAAPAG